MLVVYRVSWEEKPEKGFRFYSKVKEFYNLKFFGEFLCFLSSREYLGFVKDIVVDCYQYID